MLICNCLRGSRPFHFSWNFKGSPIDFNIKSPSRYSIDTKTSFSQFSLHDLSVADSGNYSCVVTNDFGTSVEYSVLEVNSKCF